MSYNDVLRTRPQGHLRIYDKDSGTVLLDQHNDINPENFSYAIATALGGKSSGHIKYIVFGNGGARSTSSNKFIYSVPQTVGRAATLYKTMYRKDLSIEDNDNYVKITHAPGNDYSDIVVHCTLRHDEGNDVGSDGNNGTIVNEQTFSEIGLETEGNDLITHLCFFPIQKQPSNSLVIDYILRIQIV